jgi:hypothetical protein
VPSDTALGLISYNGSEEGGDGTTTLSWIVGNHLSEYSTKIARWLALSVCLRVLCVGHRLYLQR